MNGMKVSLTPCALLEGGLLALAEAGDARHVDLVDRVRVWAVLQALHHALADNGAHLRSSVPGPLVPAASANLADGDDCGAAGCGFGAARWCRMSSLVMRPLAPVPVTSARSTLFSLAMRRTSGEERTSCDGTETAEDELRRDGRRLRRADVCAGGRVLPGPPITATTVLISTVDAFRNLDLGEDSSQRAKEFQHPPCRWRFRRAARLSRRGRRPS